MRKPTGPGRYFEYRSGLGGFVWEGMATKIDPGGSPPSRPRFLQNVRVQGGSIVSRPDFIGPGAFIPAITKYNTAVGDVTQAKNRLRLQILGADRWQPAWAAEFNSVGGTRLWWGSTPGFQYEPYPEGQGWTPTATGAIFGFLDTDSDPVVNTVGRYDSDDNWPPCIEKYNTEVYIGDFGCLRKIHQVQPPPGSQPVDVLNSPADQIVLSFPGFRCTAMTEHQGKLWLVLTDPSGTVNGEIWSYDGFVAVSEYTMAVPGVTGAAIATYKNELIVTVNGYGSIIRRNSAGAFSTHTVGGFDASPYLNSMAQYRDKLMIMDGIDKIYSWNGSVLALEHTIAPIINPESGLVPAVAFAYCCVVMNDVFYYGWTDTNFIVPTASTGGKLAYSGQPSYGNTIRIPTHATNGGYIEYTFVAAVTAIHQVKIGATEDDTYTNLKDAINKTHAYPSVNNGPAGNYWAEYYHPLFLGTTINTALNEVDLVTNIPGESGNLDGATPYPGFTNAQITAVITAPSTLTITDPTGGVGPSGEYVCIGRYDADNPVATRWSDFWVRNYYIYRYGANQLLPPSNDGAITAMAFYRGRIWVAVSGVPDGNSTFLTHSILYAPHDGWFELSTPPGADPDSVGWGNLPWQNWGGGHAGDYGFLYNQVYYLRSI